jgi:Zn-dependent peptidase ImmA (M78 family)
MSATLCGVRADVSQSYRKLEKIAEGIRESLGYQPTEAIKPLKLFEDLHKVSTTTRSGKLIPLDTGVIALEDSEGYTRYDRSNNIMEVLASEQTYLKLENRHPRAAYFIAHELGHCVLHTDQLVRLAQLPTAQQAAFHRGRADHKSFQDTEWQANALASALLMPARGIRAMESEFALVTASMIADQFSVSLEAAGYRVDLYQRRKSELLQ